MTTATKIKKIKTSLHQERSKSSNGLWYPAKILPIQFKLTIGKPNNKYEQEADSMADKIMSMPAPKSSIRWIQPKCDACKQEETQTKPLASLITPLVQRQEEEKEEPAQGKLLQLQEEEKEEPAQAKPIQRQEEEKEEEPVQTKRFSPESDTPSAYLESQLSSSKSGGSPLSDDTRSFMERRIGADFSNVKVHTDGNAVQMNKELNAQAFTHGNHVYFNSGKYSPGSNQGKHLLAHELTHVVQQKSDRLGRMILTISEQSLVKEQVQQQADNEAEVEEELYSASLGKELTSPKDSITESVQRAGEIINKQKSGKVVITKRRVKRRSISHSIGTETNATRNGHVDYWIIDKVKIYKKGKNYKASVKKLDLHTRIFIWPAATAGTWDKIKNFKPYFGKPYSPAFNMYHGTKLHEKQHVKEVNAAWKKYRTAFVSKVLALSEITMAVAKKKYDDLLKKFKNDVHSEYWKNGEIDGHRIEWQYYNSVYNKYLGRIRKKIYLWTIYKKYAKNYKIIPMKEVKESIEYKDYVKYWKMGEATALYASKRVFQRFDKGIYGRIKNYIASGRDAISRP